jgi:hypothetical protein
MENLIVTSPVFENNKPIPQKYTADGSDINPPIEIKGIPKGTKSLALIMDDPDAPLRTWDHWIVWNIPPERNKIEENTVPGVQGKNSWKKASYGGPNPPMGTHRYFFKAYALDTDLNIDPGSSKKDLEKSMEKHMLAKGELVGLYKKG